MKVAKEQVLQAALALNGEDKKYQITVEGDTIITKVKWMDATFFAPGSVTDEMREFEYVVQIGKNGKYTELDKSVSSTVSVNKSGASYQKKMFYGKEISFNKTIGLGKDKQTGETGLITNQFYSEEYKQPVREMLKSFGYKKKMGKLGKIFIGASIFGVVAVAALLIFIYSPEDKTPVDVAEFESACQKSGYQVCIDDDAENYDHIEDIRIAFDEEDDYQIDMYFLVDEESADNLYLTNKTNMENQAEEEGSSSSNSKSGSILYINIPVEFKAEAEAFIEKLGY